MHQQNKLTKKACAKKTHSTVCVCNPVAFVHSVHSHPYNNAPMAEHSGIGGQWLCAHQPCNSHLSHAETIENRLSVRSNVRAFVGAARALNIYQANISRFEIYCILLCFNMAQFENTCREWVVGQPVKVASSHKMVNGPRTGHVRLAKRCPTRSRTLPKSGWLPDHPFTTCIFKLSH